jgi:hypothetical protein
MKNLFFSFLIAFTMLITSADISSAQCAMCKQSAESSLKEGNTDAKGLNAGIMYLLIIPYALVGGIGYFWYINQKKRASDSFENE